MKAGIAGAGIMGRLLAFALNKAGWEVSIFDKDDGSAETSCSMTAIGVLTPIDELEKADLIIYQLGNDALLQYWPQILSQLGEQIYFQKSGTLILSHPDDQSELSRLIQMFSSKLNHPNSYKKVNAKEIATLEPALSKFNLGYYLAEEGHIDNQTLLKVLGKYLLDHDVNWFINTSVQDVKPGKIILKNESHQFDMVFDCRGLGAKSIFKDLRGVRGEVMWLHAPEVTLNRTIRLVHPQYSLYIVPRPNHIYLVGASVIESEDFSPISVRTTLELLTAVFNLHPAFSEARVIKTYANCRPVLPDHLPKVKYSDGFIAVNGLYRHGFLIGPAIMNDVMNWIDKGLSSVHYQKIWEKYA